MWYCFLLSLWLHCRSQWFTEYPQSWNLHGSIALSEIHWCATFSRSWFQSRWQSLCQGSVLPNHLAFKETLWKISRTLRNHLSAWHSIIYSLSSRVHALCPSSLPCIHARTCHIQHFLWENTASPHSSHNWQGTWIWAPDSSLIILSGAVHTRVEVCRMDSEMSGLVERPWLQLMCCAVCLPCGRNFRWRRESPSGSEY